ncbi:ferrochelatase [Vibrio nigripulchritudo]|uniref:precorrin-2 dehydrogenase/sirohydrochlorin ferrochelatase family protein n=1 Tax=Vibrio nigripulchritudo TaxID=28173 RepID=UPI00190CC71C|nr:bifunctional precorrin-2 dehydrogenase/sirohydrochlorin ferrochelatase [Vibrio nigripulchritudo]BCL69628.1 ferrochelatase [Vibrio nigripulchritudo]BDU30975.1 ferrochelatase [Vibrio nigripulchritudo]
MRYFPLFFDLNHKPVLVVGGGEVASRKVDSLLRAGADVTIISPKIDPYLQKLVEEQKCHWVKAFYSPDMMTDYIQVWATTDNPELNHKVHADAKHKGIMVNVVDDQPYCDFITPSMVNRGRIQIAISSGGASPVLVRNIREKLESLLSQNVSLLAEFAASKRNSIKESLPSVDSRRKFWEAFFSDPKLDTVEDRAYLEELYEARLNDTDYDSGSMTWLEYSDDVELMSIKGLRLMQQAELVLAHKDCPFEFVDLCRRDAERETFSSYAELSAKLAHSEIPSLRVVVFFPKGEQHNPELKILAQNQTLVEIASTR